MFAQRLKKLRQEKNLLQSQLAEEIGISNRTISMYEQGNSEPNTEILIKLSHFFNVSIDYLVGNSNCKNVEKHVFSKATGLTEEIINLLETNRDYHFLYFDRSLINIKETVSLNANYQKNSSEILNDFIEYYFDNLVETIYNYLSIGVMELCGEPKQDGLAYNVENIKMGYLYELQSKFVDFIKQQEKDNSNRVAEKMKNNN